MNDLSFRDQIDGHADFHRDDQAVDRDTQKPQKARPKVRRRCGARLFAMGAFLLLAGGVGLGAWRHSSQQQGVIATAEEERDFVPSVRVATVKASPSVMSVTLPATTAAFAQAEIYARVTGYVSKRLVDIGDRVKEGQLRAELAVPEQDDQISQNEAMRNQLQSGAGQPEARTGDLGPGPPPGQ